MGSWCFSFPLMISFVGFFVQVSHSGLRIVPDWAKLHGITYPGLSNTLIWWLPEAHEFL